MKNTDTIVKSFIIKVLWLGLPCIGLLLSIEIIHRCLPHEFSERKKLIANQKFNGYILGSSHTFYGLNPEKISNASLLNLGWPSQDLKTDFRIYDELLKDTKFDYLVLDCSIHMLPYLQSMESKANDKDSYDIYYFNSLKSHVLAFSVNSIIKREKKFFLNSISNKPFLRTNEVGFAYRQNKIEIKEKAISDAKNHGSIWNNSDVLEENIQRLNHIIEQSRNKKVVLYLSPLHPLYRENISPAIWTRYFNIIGRLSANDNVSVINFINIFDKHLNNFQDGDHVLPQAADVLSAQFNIALGEVIHTADKLYANKSRTAGIQN